MGVTQAVFETSAVQCQWYTVLAMKGGELLNVGINLIFLVIFSEVNIEVPSTLLRNFFPWILECVQCCLKTALPGASVVAQQVKLPPTMPAFSIRVKILSVPPLI